MDSTICRVKGAKDKPSIGKGIVNSRMYVMDENQEPVPVGVAGELYIGGKGVGRGYLNREELTKERFIERKGERIYRTGDRVRWQRGGELEYLGRTDNQVKVRGYRIELGEIESVLKENEKVKEAVVMVKGEEGRGETTGSVPGRRRGEA